MVSVKNAGTAVITATKSGDSQYLDASTSYTINASNKALTNYVELTAWLGDKDALISLSPEAVGASLYSSSASNCDFSNYTNCNLGQMNIFNGAPILDKASAIDDTGYYQLKVDNKKANLTLSKDSFYWNRTQFPVVNFKGKLWVIGGNSVAGGLNDVWSSTDGAIWKQETQNAEFSGRTRHTVIEFQNKLWLFGGDNGKSTPENLDFHDVWTSDDAIHWAKISENTTLAPSTVFNGRLWATHKASSDFFSSDATWGIYSSEDAIQWKLEKADIFNGEIEDRSDLYAKYNLFLFNNKIWTVKTTLSGDQPSGSIWSSADGTQWEKHPKDKDMPLSKPVIFNNKLWIVGSFHRDYIWTSADGTTWTKEKADQSFKQLVNEYGTNDFEAPVVFNNKIYLLNGSTAWSSEDGASWTRHTTEVEFKPRVESHLVEHNNKIILYGGLSSHYDDHLDAWSSKDGAHWQQLHIPDEPTGHILISFNQKLWLIGRFHDYKLNIDTTQIWSSPDEGQTWNKESTNLSIAGRRDSPLVTVLNNKLLLIDGIYALMSADGVQWDRQLLTGFIGDPLGTNITFFKGKLWIYGVGRYQYSSTDGIFWVKDQDLSMPNIPEQYFNSEPEIVFNDKLWRIGSVKTEGGLPTSSIWSSTDRITWLKEADTAAFSPRKGHRLISYNNKLFMVGGDTSINGIRDINNEVWSSSDGKEWRLAYKATFELK